MPTSRVIFYFCFLSHYIVIAIAYLFLSALFFEGQNRVLFLLEWGSLSSNGHIWRMVHGSAE